MPSDLLTVAEVKEHVTTGLSRMTALGPHLIDAQDAYILRMVGPHDPRYHDSLRER